MVVESIIRVKESLKTPWQFLIATMIITFVSFLISFIIFKHDVGLYSVFLITIGLIPITFRLNKYAFKKSSRERPKSIISVFSYYKEIILAYASIFIGITTVLSILYMILPEEISIKTFQTQINEIKSIRGYFSFGGAFQTIFFNNIGVLMVCFAFSLIYGAGAVFILTWNASILSTAIGMTAKALGGMSALPLAVLVYFPHGSLEILAYFLGAIAGGIASNCIVKNVIDAKIFQAIAFLLLVGIFLLFLGALIETVSIVLG
ncbi:MAG: stage II sporulation protein M [Candidatus Aenigmarchaeota archaeon]|nr:stage II sporulation protein M [Candidatus Aenigmarchaeota archaeon]MDW8160089.1 stage II sporulation protein M [Candidatus Aenigmarchaeota archaeon]